MSASGLASTRKVVIGHKKKTALVCSGGAAKAGAFHLGVALALREHGFRFRGGLLPKDHSPEPILPMDISVYVGSSAGAVITGYLAAGHSVDDVMNAFLDRKPEDPTQKYLPRLTYSKMFHLHGSLKGQGIKRMLPILAFKRFVQDLMTGSFESLFELRWLTLQGIFSTSGIEKYFREEVLSSNQFQDLEADLYVVATQLNHSRKVVFGKYGYRPPPNDLTCQYHNDGKISDAIAASTSLPPIFAPYSMMLGEGTDQKKMDFIDGEIRDTLSTHVAVDAGCDLIFASYTHQPYHFKKNVGSLMDHGLPSIIVQSIYLLIEQKINNHIHNKEIQRKAILTIHDYCKKEGISKNHTDRILEILESELYHKLDVDTIYIHPSPRDDEMFFGDYFNLSPKKMTEVVRSGFRAAIDKLRKYEFADRKEKKAVGQMKVDVV